MHGPRAWLLSLLRCGRGKLALGSIQAGIHAGCLCALAAATPAGHSRAGTLCNLMLAESARLLGPLLSELQIAWGHSDLFPAGCQASLQCPTL